MHYRRSIYSRKLLFFGAMTLLLFVGVLISKLGYGKKQPLLDGECRVYNKDGICELGVCFDKCDNAIGNAYPNQCPTDAPICCRAEWNKARCEVDSMVGTCCDCAAGAPRVFPTQCSSDEPQCCAIFKS